MQWVGRGKKTTYVMDKALIPTQENNKIGYKSFVLFAFSGFSLQWRRYNEISCLTWKIWPPKMFHMGGILGRSNTCMEYPDDYGISPWVVGLDTNVIYGHECVNDLVSKPKRVLI